MNVHFIAVGGSIMHNLAIALHKKGYKVSGSDDEIFEPAKSRLQKHNLLPGNVGWDASRIHSGLDAIILGMHARADNPEVEKARELGLRIYSFPEFVAEQAKNQKRVVIAGSHGKTTITSMIMHILQTLDIDFDYLVGSSVAGFEDSVKLGNAPVIIIEGDEYLTSALDLRPKFLWYNPDVALISGIAWDHINVFPTYEGYLDQFRKFIDLLGEGDVLVYNAEDEEVMKLVRERKSPGFFTHPYITPTYTIADEVVILKTPTADVPLRIFGRHNLLNMEGARHICAQLNIDDVAFYNAMKSFSGAGKRLEKIAEGNTTVIYRDFAHAPSKVEASISAVKELYAERKLVGIIELHTYSSLQKNFLPQYLGTANAADELIIYISSEALKIKKREMLEEGELKKAFGRNDLKLFTNRKQLEDYLSAQNWENTALLLMSSGSFDGLGNEEMVEVVRP